MAPICCVEHGWITPATTNCSHVNDVAKHRYILANTFRFLTVDVSHLAHRYRVHFIHPLQALSISL